MTILSVLAVGAGIAALVYLIYALVKPEKFL
ncbi:potassium-transporting ATPase subunit F [Timonella sp. A28]